MFCVNDSIMYNNIGVCKVTDIRCEKFNNEEILYYILKPVYHDNATIHCPVGSDKVKLRKLLSTEQVTKMIEMMPKAKPNWIENDSMRKEKFSETLKHGNHKDLVQLIKTLYHHRQEKAHAGKKFHLCDEKVLKQAENILYEEFAHVLNIAPDEVVDFIIGMLKKSDTGKQPYEH